MAATETVLLDPMTGFEFEEFFARLLDKLGYGTIERVLTSHDEGRDILVRSPGGLIVVECKHQPKTGIGRPIVQKLHSAVISSKAIRGILATTGHFTPEALEYAHKLFEQGTQIEMVDYPMLADMAARVGIAIASKGRLLDVQTYARPPAEATRFAFGDYLRQRAASSPRTPDALVRNYGQRLLCLPFYLVTYSVNAIFSTSVGILGRESVPSAWIAVDGVTGTVYSSQQMMYLAGEPTVPFSGVESESGVELRQFQVDMTSLHRLAKDAIRKAHSRQISWTGRNNQTYHPTFEPKEHEVALLDVREVYIPYARIDFDLMRNPYHADIFHAPSGRLTVTNDEMSWCRMCLTPITGRPLLCDLCGRSVHPRDRSLASAHGLGCQNCGRTVCREHGASRRRLLLFKAYLCLHCAAAAKKRGSKVKLLAPLVRKAPPVQTPGRP